MSSSDSDYKRPPICPPKPVRTWTQAPHRPRPPRPPKPQRLAPAPKPEKPARKFHQPGTTDWELFRIIIDSYREQRREALQIIKDFKAGSRAFDPEIVRQARNFLNNWRESFIEEVNESVGQLRKPLAPSTPYTPPVKPGTIKITGSFERLVNTWRERNAPRLRAMTTAELRIRYHASRVLRHAGDTISRIDALDIADTTIATAMASQAFRVLKDDLAQPGNDDIIDAMMDLPRLPDPALNPITTEEEQQIRTDTNPNEPLPSLIIGQIVSIKEWAQSTKDTIETGIRKYLTENRWNVFGSHFGAALQDLNDVALPTILNDQQAIKYELTPENAVFISLLKATIAPDHSDTPEDLIAWFEELQLWIEEHDLQEIPPATIRELAALHGVDLLPIAPQPGSPGSP